MKKSTVISVREAIAMDEVITNSGIDAVIYRVARKAAIPQQAATVAVDEVLTAVKQKLPPSMASRLVEVVAGETEFDRQAIPLMAHVRRVAVTKLKNLDIATRSARIWNTIAHVGGRYWKNGNSLLRRVRLAITRKSGPAAGH